MQADDETEAGPDPAPGGRRPIRRVAHATPIVDTQKSGKLMGVRAPELAQRRILYRAPLSFIEIAVPPRFDPRGENWICGQWFIPKDDRWRWSGPTRAILRKTGEPEALGDAIVDEYGTFALPFTGEGEYDILLEPLRGTPVSVAFTC